MEPAAFAAQLIARLERLKREQETMSSLEERLQQIQEVLLEFYKKCCLNVVTSSIEKFREAYSYRTFWVGV